MNRKELVQLGIPAGEIADLVMMAVKSLVQQGLKNRAIATEVSTFAANPDAFAANPAFREASLRWAALRAARADFSERETPAPWQCFGEDLDENATEQMENACRLPIAVRGALMPDAHLGYGLPIGGVLATRDAVIPYAVGMDIACRMKLTVLDLPPSILTSQPERLKRALEQETRFGVGATFKAPRDHEVMAADWSISPITKRNHGKAHSQLGTSGSGNHFVEFGLLTLETPELGLRAGVYLALLSHSGSRGTGGDIARHYSNLAMAKHPELPKQLRHLAWLELGQQEGEEYWRAMELMGRYAAASHQLIHKHIAKHLGAKVLAEVENHHNFAWREKHDGREVIVHRKGATPARKGVLGIIPGSMATPGFVVRGRGEGSSLESASHGAGRRMSRTAAKERFNLHQLKEVLAAAGVTLLSAGLDEVPMAYKPIESVMACQRDLVTPIARFDPKLVKMAPGDEKPED